jgi:phage-related protein
MPRTVIRIYRHLSGETPVTDWLDRLEKKEPKAYRKCLQRILLSEKGNELRRPFADMLRDGIYELRAKVGRVNFRILYFFCGQHMACLSHGITKEGKVPDEEIEHALTRKRLVMHNRDKYTAEWET